MLYRTLTAAAFAVAFSLSEGALASDWMFDQSLYTNNPRTGKRVIQYQKPDKAYRAPAATYFSIDGPKPFGLFSYDFNDPYYGYFPSMYGYGMWGFNGGMPLDGGDYSFGHSDVPGYESWAD